ncbi:hypothetical protein BJF78_24790 [Pseudonocardia sp. CNS-139]|nr:hypothetical protein BJF78_24790 [Pseudonocardia sp. CNS-139]
MTAADLDEILRTGVATHEAAHAVGLAAAGIRFTDVLVGHQAEMRDPTGHVGAVQGQVRGDTAQALRRRLPYVAALLAGMLAESRVLGVDVEILAGSCGARDLDIAHHVADGLNPDAAIDMWRAADRLVTRHAAAIAVTAAALQTRGRLTEADVIAIVHEHPPRKAPA